VSNLTSFISEAFDDHLQFLSVEAEVEGVIYNALPSEAEIAPNLDIGGVSDEADGAIIIKKSSILITPKVGTRIRVDGKDYRIRSIVESVGNPLVVIEYSGATER
jgi:hypothetical protein